VEIYDSRFEANTATYVSSSNLVSELSELSLLQFPADHMELCFQNGGAISIPFGTLVIHGSTFHTNVAGTVSGGVMVSRIFLIFFPYPGGGHATNFNWTLLPQLYSVCDETRTSTAR
jgi:hypothetical protein